MFAECEKIDGEILKHAKAASMWSVARNDHLLKETKMAA